MIRSKRLVPAFLLLPLLAPCSVSALVVEIQGARLESQIIGSSCVEIAGSFSGVTIEASENGKSPRLCYNSNKVNSISILNSTFIATSPLNQEVLIKFEHGFPSGLNGKIMARANLRGFFSTADGIGTPEGDQLSMAALFSQAGHEDPIGDPLQLKVGKELDSALFEYAAKKQYLITGPRVLRGVLKLVFTGQGHKLNLAGKNAVVIDTGSMLVDKLDTMSLDATEPGANPTPQTENGASPNLPMPKSELPGTH